MNNLHRELAPISAAAWEAIDEEATRTFKRNNAGRRLVDVNGPLGLDLAAVTTGRRAPVDPPFPGIEASTRTSQAIVELKVPFTVSRQAIDDVDRGAQDSDWDPVIVGARTIAQAEDRAIFEGYPAAGISGIRSNVPGEPIKLPGDVREYPEAISQALSKLRLSSVNGPYSLALSAETWLLVNETSNHGYPIIQHLQRLIDGDIVWAPAIESAVLLSTRGGDFDLTIGQDVSIGYDSHDATSVNLYFQESFTFLVYTGEAAVSFDTSGI
jgi:uncharacterized linocin/CFP29 family protein